MGFIDTVRELPGVRGVDVGQEFSGRIPVTITFHNYAAADVVGVIGEMLVDCGDAPGALMTFDVTETGMPVGVITGFIDKEKV